jgi:hypothetical protein
MSTKFGILTEQVDHEKLVDEDGDLLDYISHGIFEPVFHRGQNSRWLNSIGPYLSDNTRVYALDNTQQGIFTIGDIKKFMKEYETNT